MSRFNVLGVLFIWLKLKISFCMLSMRRLDLPEAHNRTLLADIALGLMLCSLRCCHSVQDRKPNHGLRLQVHPVNKLSRVYLHFIVYLYRK